MDEFPAESFDLMVEKEWLLIESAYVNHYCKEIQSRQFLNPQQAQQWDQKRQSSWMANLIGIFEWTRAQASRVPPDIITEYITPKWLIKKGLERCPKAVETIRSKGEKGERWIQLQCAEIILYLTGRLQWNMKLMRMVRITG